MITHVLLDADGVLQDLPGGWYAAMEPFPVSVLADHDIRIDTP